MFSGNPGRRAAPDPDRGAAALRGGARAQPRHRRALVRRRRHVQPMPDASPAKWHLAHTTWFFETFLLRDHVPGYRLYDERWAYLFNSYYEGEGDRHARPRRGMLSRAHARRGARLSRRGRRRADRRDPRFAAGADLVELGLHHEQQHQELMLTDIIATFAENPLQPAVWESAPRAARRGGADPMAGRAAGASSRSATPAPASPSTASGRATRLPAAARARRPPGHQCRMARLHRRRRLCQPRAVAGRRLDLGAGERHRGAALLAARRRGLVALRPRRAQAARSRRAGLPHLLLRGRRLSPAGPARGCRPRRNGKARRPADDPLAGNQLDAAGPVRPRPSDRRRPVRQRLGMDRQRLSSLSGLRARRGRGRRI